MGLRNYCFCNLKYGCYTSMKVGTVVYPNQKGQIVIPKKIRDSLGIDEEVPLNISQRGGGLYLHPVKEVIGDENDNKSFFKILDNTRGAWAGDDWLETEKRRRKIEIEESRQRKRAW